MSTCGILRRGPWSRLRCHCCQDYVRVTKDWNGDKVLRRKTLGAFRIAGRGAGDPEVQRSKRVLYMYSCTRWGKEAAP
eukprot:6489509-Amphidinium_carterae.1